MLMDASSEQASDFIHRQQRITGRSRALPLVLSVQLGFPPVQVDFGSQFRGSFRLRLISSL
jgi:hypothetical protein